MNAALGAQAPAQGPFANFARDFAASIVVFLVAMPLCMGIAIASGAPPEMGLVTGIIGGIVVGFLAGSPLQVSGPAAGLAVIVFEFIREHGLAALGPMLVLAGILQLIAGVMKLGGAFRSISPAVVHGMLAGIGALIVVGQFHTLFDAPPLSSGLENLMAIPGRVFDLSPNLRSTELALMIGVLTIVVMLGWEKLRPASMKLVPGALLGVVAATVAAYAFGLEIARVAVPESISAAFSLPGDGFLAPLATPAIVLSALVIAFIASAETLLSAAAVDRMHDGTRTDYNRELRAQGIGNLLCGVAGGLPMTGVIVRSSANVQAGAKSRLSTILHGTWILGFVALLPWLLREIPMAALGGVLVVTGWRLVSLQHVRHLLHVHGRLPALIWLVTFVLVVATDLLTGVLAGLALSLVELLPHRRGLKLQVTQREEGDATHVVLNGSATFLSLARLNAVLEALPENRPVRLNLDAVNGMDHTASETLGEWLSRQKKRGTDIEVTGCPTVTRSLAMAG